jgi:PEGA domain
LRIAFLVLLVATAAQADDARLDKAEREMARAHALMAQHEYAAALQHFQAARELAPETSGPLLGIGLAAAALDRCDQAVPALTEYLRKKPDSPSPQARPSLEACEKRLAPAPPPPTPAVEKGGVHLESLPIGAEVRIDQPGGDIAGHTPIDLSLPPGAHTLYLSQDGYRNGRFDATIVAGVTIRLSVQLDIVPPPAPPPAPRGKLELYVEPPPVTVLLNGGKMPGTGPTFGAEVPGGMYRIVIEKQGYDPEYRDVLVRPGEKVVQKHTFAPRWPLKKKRWVAAVAVLVPLAAVGLAVGLGVGLTESPPSSAPKETFFGTLRVTP